MVRIAWPGWRWIASALLLPVAALLVLGASGLRASDREVPRPLKLAWLVDLGSEAMAVNPRPLEAQGSLWISVPGAALAFSVDGNGALTKLSRLPSDFSSAFGLATSGQAAVVANRSGELTLWRSPEPGAAPELQWRSPLGSRATSVAWNGADQIWAATRDGRLLALGDDDGEEVWSIDMGGRAEAPPVASGGDLYVATKSRTLLRIDTETGTVRWRRELAGPVIHPPVLTAGDSPLVVCGTWSGTLAAFEASSGNRVWSLELPGKLAGAPVAGVDKIAAVTENGAVHVHDLRGQPVWSASEIAEGPASLSIATHEGTSRLLVVSQRLALLDLATGAPIDSYPEGAEHDLRDRFVASMMEGEKTWSEVEKHAAREREAFIISGPLFGPARRMGNGLAFATEDGWVYFFETATLRPTFRYRAGQPAAGLPRLTGDRLVAAAGEEVFALAPATGQVLWRRGVGGSVREVTGGDTLAVLAGDRMTTLDAKNGSRGWTQRRGVRFVSAKGELWLVADDDGKLRALNGAGTQLGELSSGGTLLRPVPLGTDATWAVATEEGRVFGVAWVAGSPGRLELIWEYELGTKIRDLRRARGRLLVRLGDGALLSLDPHTRREVWRRQLDETEDVTLVNDDHAFVVHGGDTVRIYDSLVGRITFAREAPAEAVGIALDGARLHWLDRAGFAHTVDIRDGRFLRSSDLGVPLESAAHGPAGFVIRTAAGEIGVVVGRDAARFQPLPTDNEARTQETDHDSQNLRHGSGARAAGGHDWLHGGAALALLAQLRDPRQGEAARRRRQEARGAPADRRHGELHQPRGSHRGLGDLRADRQEGQVQLARAPAGRVRG